MAAIGIDLDNTIISYTKSLQICVNQLYPDLTLNHYEKGYVKEYIVATLGEHSWMKLQGQLYTLGLKFALPFCGALNVMKQLHRSNHTLYIISHKTQFGHFDSSYTDLRVAAIAWLTSHGFLETAKTGLSVENVFFCDTHQEKINKINVLQCQIFIDDLLDVLQHQDFPRNCKKILFSPALSTKAINDILPICNWSQVLDSITEIAV